VQVSPLETKFDAIGGVSGGVFGLYGWLTAYCWRERLQLPSQFWTTIFFFSVLNISVAALLSVKASLTAHVVGFGLGAALGFLENRISGRSRKA
jgi:membrane associated rhomboid family serine protease